MMAASSQCGACMGRAFHVDGCPIYDVVGGMDAIRRRTMHGRKLSSRNEKDCIFLCSV